MKRILLDTSVVIDFLRRKDKERSLLVKLLRLRYSLAISLIVHTELYAGRNVWRKPKAKKELEELLSGLEIIVVSEKVSQLAGQLSAKYRVGLLDAIIAAEAIVSRLPLATFNLKDFKKIKELRLLKEID